ncbi:MAG: VOC family protein [Treponema sp.]|nr:VOC family protein [Treponema sp.]
MEKFPTSHIVKIGIVVKDLEAAAKKYAEIFGIPVPKINFPSQEKLDEDAKGEPASVFRGSKAHTRCITTVINLEPIHIELIQPVAEPSPWTEFLDAKGQGVHYMAFEAPEGFKEVEDFMASKGVPIYHKTEKGSSRYGYFETAEELGITVEFKEIDS